MNTTPNKSTQTQNSSQSTTADSDNYSYQGQALTWHEKLAATFLWFCCVGIVYFLLTGCSQTVPSSPTKTLLIPSYLADAQASSDTAETHLTEFPVNQESEEAASEPEQSVQTAPAHLGSIELNPKRLITLSGVIDSHVLEKANQLYSLSEESKRPIDILIASPGGYIGQGLYFIQAMTAVKAKGITIRCVVSNLAASMAYVIFTQCDERYALPMSQLLFHPPRIPVNSIITPNGAAQLTNDLKQIEAVLLRLIIPTMQLDGKNPAHVKWFVTNYLEERLFTAEELAQESPVAWFQVVDHVSGAADLFPNPYKGLELTGQKKNEIIYIKGKQ